MTKKTKLEETDTDMQPVEVETVEETVEQDPNALQATDLNTMATVIEATAQRGAIRANEMQIVGQLYTKLNHFLVTNGFRQAAPATDQAQEASADAPEVDEVELTQGE